MNHLNTSLYLLRQHYQTELTDQIFQDLREILVVIANNFLEIIVECNDVLDQTIYDDIIHKYVTKNSLKILLNLVGNIIPDQENPDTYFDKIKVNEITLSRKLKIPTLGSKKSLKDIVYSILRYCLIDKISGYTRNIHKRDENFYRENIYSKISLKYVI
jgi:hypothetical protein